MPLLFACNKVWFSLGGAHMQIENLMLGGGGGVNLIAHNELRVTFP